LKRTIPHYLRFARTLAFTSAATTACDGGGVLFPPDATESDARPDATVDAMDATIDTHDGATDETDALAPGSCRVAVLDAARDLTCPPGFTCSYPDDASVRCTYGMDAAGDGGENQECGSILCGEYCYCIGPAANVCGCFQGPSGPLSPPDLARDIMRRRLPRDAQPAAIPALRPRPDLRRKRRVHRV
jgi:hypothetical protein